LAILATAWLLVILVYTPLILSTVTLDVPVNFFANTKHPYRIVSYITQRCAIPAASSFVIAF